MLLTPKDMQNLEHFFEEIDLELIQAGWSLFKHVSGHNEIRCHYYLENVCFVVELSARNHAVVRAFCRTKKIRRTFKIEHLVWPNSINEHVGLSCVLANRHSITKEEKYIPLKEFKKFLLENRKVLI